MNTRNKRALDYHVIRFPEWGSETPPEGEPYLAQLPAGDLHKLKLMVSRIAEASYRRGFIAGGRIGAGIGVDDGCPIDLESAIDEHANMPLSMSMAFHTDVPGLELRVWHSLERLQKFAPRFCRLARAQEKPATDVNGSGL